MNKTLRELAELVGGSLLGEDRIIAGIAGIDEAGPSQITFAVHPYFEKAAASKAGAVVIPADITEFAKPAIRVSNPRLAFSRLVNLFNPPPAVERIVHPTAVVGRNVKISPEAAVMAYAVIGNGVTIGAGTIIYPHAFIGDDCVIGEDCLLHPRVTLRERTILGNRVFIQSGAVLGGDGFGFLTVEGQHLKVPQVGHVVIEDDVEIGACSAVDRATMGTTLIKRGTKIDNFVHIAHNVVVGEHCLIAAMTGISGSVTVGHHVTMAGQTGTNGHINIGENSVFIARAGITKDSPPNAFYAGVPARPHSEWAREQVALHKLPETLKKIKELEKKLALLESRQ